jgi:FtsP/CotA-like multicopper oxidase with cupredoxin domain
MYTFTRKLTRLLFALAFALGSLAISRSSASAASVGFNLCASDGTITMPDSTVVDVWGFVETASSCAPGLVNDTNFPGPVLDVNEGDVVTINLSNALPAGHTLEFEIPGITFNPSLTDGSAPITFTASAPGTYLYQSGGDAGRQEAMGLYGALIVRPAAAGQAYNSATTAYDVEATLVLSQIDPNFNAAPDTYSMYDYRATFWLINGKAYPETAPILASGGQRVLLRYVNAGYDNTTMMLLGAHERVLARDASLLHNPFFADAETIPAGGTEDAVAVVPVDAPPSANGFALYNRQLHTGMMTFIQSP